MISFSKKEAINPKNSWIPIPSENNETRPAGITNEEFKVYSEGLQKLFTNVGLYNSSLYLNVLSLFRDAFLKPSENRPFRSGTYVRLEFGATTSESVKKQNIPCEICAENRATDICHIIPKRLRGVHDIDNVLYLCPTHHRLFDNCMLSKDEWEKIDWCSKKREISSICIQST